MQRPDQKKKTNTSTKRRGGGFESESGAKASTKRCGGDFDGQKKEKRQAQKKICGGDFHTKRKRDEVEHERELENKKKLLADEKCCSGDVKRRSRWNTSTTSTGRGIKGRSKPNSSSSLTLLEQALELEPLVSVGRQSFQLRPVGRVVGDRAVEEPVRPHQVLCRVLCRSSRSQLSRDRREGGIERRLRV